MFTTTNDQTILTTNDTELVQCLQGNNERQFSRLYDRFAGSLFGVIVNKVGDAEVAENLLQDVFVKAWRCRHLYDAGKGRLFTWLYNITRSLCIDHLRSKTYKKTKASLLSDDLSVIIQGADPNGFSPDNIGLKEMLHSLKREEKEVIELMYFQGFTQREIAEMMQLPLGTVKTRMRRGIKNLRYIFTEEWKGATQAISLN